MSFNDQYIFVEGKSTADHPVRPHNWAERFAGNLATYDHYLRMSFSDELLPVMVQGVKCLRLKRCLLDNHPELFRDVMAFADTHQLPVHGLHTDRELPLAS